MFEMIMCLLRRVLRMSVLVLAFSLIASMANLPRYRPAMARCPDPDGIGKHNFMPGSNVYGQICTVCGRRVDDDEIIPAEESSSSGFSGEGARKGETGPGGTFSYLVRKHAPHLHGDGKK